jgi:hypothetical protein
VYAAAPDQIAGKGIGAADHVEDIDARAPVGAELGAQEVALLNQFLAALRVIVLSMPWPTGSRREGTGTMQVTKSERQQP